MGVQRRRNGVSRMLFQTAPVGRCTVAFTGCHVHTRRFCSQLEVPSHSPSVSSRAAVSARSMVPRGTDVSPAGAIEEVFACHPVSQQGRARMGLASVQSALPFANSSRSMVCPPAFRAGTRLNSSLPLGLDIFPRHREAHVSSERFGRYASVGVGDVGSV